MMRLSSQMGPLTGHAQIPSNKALYLPSIQRQTLAGLALRAAPPASALIKGPTKSFDHGLEQVMKNTACLVSNVDGRCHTRLDVELGQ